MAIKKEGSESKHIFLGNTEGANTPKDIAGYKQYEEALLRNLNEEEAKEEDTLYIERDIKEFDNFDEQPANDNLVVVIPAFVPKKGIILNKKEVEVLKGKHLQEYFAKNRYHLVVAVSPTVAANGIHKGDYISLEAEQGASIYVTPKFRNDYFTMLRNHQVRSILIKDNTPKSE